MQQKESGSTRLSDKVTREAAPPKPYGELTPEEQANARTVISLGFEEGLKQSLATGSDTFAFEVAGSGDVMFMVMLRPRAEVMGIMKAVEELRAQAVERSCKEGEK